MKASLHLQRHLIDAPSRHATALRLSSVALTSAVLSSLSSIFASLRLSFSPSLCLRNLRESLRAVSRPPRNLLAVAASLALIANIASTLATYPHTLSYFNEVAGGPLNGPAHLLDANVDWGQDLLFLKEWHDARPESRPMHLAWFGVIDPRIAGIGYEPIPRAPFDTNIDLQQDRHQPSTFGCCAASRNDLYGYKFFWDNKDGYSWLRSFKPADFVGYSIHIFRL